MCNESWLKLYYKRLQEWEWYTEPNTSHLFLHCLIKANKSDKTWQGKKIEKASFITSLAHLSLETGLSIRNIRTALKNLVSTNEVTIKTTNKYSLINIVRMDYWLGFDNAKKTKGDKQNDTSTTTTIDSITKNKDIKKDIFGEFNNVKLSKVEYLKLKEIYNSSERLNKGIEILSSYLASVGDKYKNHYAVLGKSNWVYKKVEHEMPLLKGDPYNAFA